VTIAEGAKEEEDSLFIYECRCIISSQILCVAAFIIHFQVRLSLFAVCPLLSSNQSLVLVLLAAGVFSFIHSLFGGRPHIYKLKQ
jgi:hypothetical protein